MLNSRRGATQLAYANEPDGEGAHEARFRRLSALASSHGVGQARHYRLPVRIARPFDVGVVLNQPGGKGGEPKN